LVEREEEEVIVGNSLHRKTLCPIVGAEGEDAAFAVEIYCQ
jgi:hypothetical protein